MSLLILSRYGICNPGRIIRSEFDIWFRDIFFLVRFKISSCAFSKKKIPKSLTLLDHLVTASGECSQFSMNIIIIGQRLNYKNIVHICSNRSICFGNIVSYMRPNAAERCRILKISIYIKQKKNFLYLPRNAHKHTSSMD